VVKTMVGGGTIRRPPVLHGRHHTVPGSHLKRGHIP
jgi:hypothetical protein